MREHKYHLSPLFSARNRQEYEQGISGKDVSELAKYENTLSDADEIFSVDGFCIPCGKIVPFQVDMQAGGRKEKGVYLPNWRERLICPSCNMSNRQRLMATLVMQHLHSDMARQYVYLMERTTPLFKWISNTLCDHSIVGSEYFGADKKGGSLIGPFEYQTPLRFDGFLNSLRHKFSLFYSMFRMGGVRHEDITSLSFPDGSLDLIVSNDVFEHVPNPISAFRECARVLRPGGQILATIPFHSNCAATVIRAELDEKGVQYKLTASYHGNPVSAEGSLVFTDFGWDIIQSFVAAGFAGAEVEIYGSKEYGHLGVGQLIFRITK
jgi:SAM-dependent methyltransferase